MNGNTQTVFVVDDAEGVRKPLGRVLAAGGHRVRLFDSAEAFLAEHDPDTAGCLLLDICMPGLSGIELQHALVESASPLPIIFLTGMGDIQSGVAAMKDGAVDYLTKPVDNVRLFAAVEQALQRDDEQRRQASIRRAIRQRLDTLTPREREVLMMSKMAARSLVELVQLAARVGVEIEPAVSVSANVLSWKPAQGPLFKQLA